MLNRFAAAVLVAMLAPAASAAAAPPTCLTPVAADGHEPPCNPYGASTVWTTAHRGPYAQGSSAYPGPVPGDDVRLQSQRFPLETPTILQVTDPYPDGGRALWFTTSGVPDPGAVYKVDYDSLKVLGRFDTVAADGEQRQPKSSTSGVYNLLARGNRFVALRERRIEVFTDAQPGVHDSGIRRLKRFDLPPKAFCRADDRIVGITLLYTGQIAFATFEGVVGVVPVDTDRMDAAHLRTLSLNGKDCGDSRVATDDLEQVSNSISADEDGGIYIVTSQAMHRVDFRRGRLSPTWRAKYETGVKRGSTLSAGSGSTPDVTGTDPGDDKFAVITDGQRLAHLVLFWRKRIPRNWKRIAPGKDRRIACEAPIRFGDPNATDSASEQSVLTRGYASVVVNNALALDPAFAVGLPEGISQAIAQGGTSQIPGNTPRGIERIDWDPHTRTCKTVWANRDVSIPNAVPTLSTATGLIYSTGLENGVFGLEAIDFATGAERMFVPSGATPEDNSFYSATTVGADGTIFQGTIQRLNAYRTDPKPAPPLACKDVSDPSISLRRSRSRIGPRRVVLRGRVSDRACGKRARVRRVGVIVRHRGRDVLRGRARLTQSGTRFGFLRHRAPPRGRYRIVLRATDQAGRTSAAMERLRRKSRRS